MSSTPTDRVRAAYRTINEIDRPEVWISLRDEHDLLVEAKEIEDRLAEGEHLPLAGLTLAVKDNIDVAGLPTTAACPAYTYMPTDSATAVHRLTAAGALVLGKTNLDQFATGLVGTRSPYGAVRHAHQPDRISGGSSSGSAVAVALGIADLALGTDTAGSGRVPAALHGLVGLKPTLGLVPNTGVVPAARSYDCVTIFADTLTLAQRAVALMIGPDPRDPSSRDWPASVRLGAGPSPRVAVPDAAGLAPLSVEASDAFRAAADRLRAYGAVVEEIDIAPFLAAAALLYGGALVAERYAAVGEFLTERARVAPDGWDSSDGIDPTVAGIILAAATVPAHRLVADLERLDRHKAEADTVLAGFDALLLPTTTGHPTMAEVHADPVGVNSRMGVYTNFVNLLDMAAVAVPAGTADGSPFGVTVVTRAFEDQVAIDLAARLTGEQAGEPLPPTGVDLVVFGAHMRGQPLNGELTGLGARFAGTVRTAPAYRMVALSTVPPKPGVLRVASSRAGGGGGPGPEVGGGALAGERWTMSPAALGTFLARLPAPMSLGVIELDDGEGVTGFHCDPVTAARGEDITTHGSWLAYLDA